MKNYKNYWDENIDKWGALYLEISHGSEIFKGPVFISKLYNRFVVPTEATLMKTRYQKTMGFIDKSISAGMRVSDIGCGTGIFTISLLKKGAHVNAIDISEKSLEITKKNVEKYTPEYCDRVSYFLRDPQYETLPKSDASLCVGVLPYVKNIDSFMTNILISTDMLYVQFSSSFNFFNILRRMLPFLNVRKLNFQSLPTVKQICKKRSFTIASNEKFATGYLTLIHRENFIRETARE